MHQVYSDFLPSIGQTLRLGGDERHYLGRVLRAKNGEEVRIANGQGQAVAAVLRGFDADDAVFEVLSAANDSAETWSLHLGLCPPRGDAFDEAQEAAVQLGVESLTLIKSQRTLANFDGGALQPDRLTKRMREACRQCERSKIPATFGPLALENYLVQPREGIRLLASERGGQSLIQTMYGVLAGSAIHCLVGPEGGFSADELAMGLQSGWTPVTLGPRPLRVPVAVTALCAGLRTLQP